MRDAVMRRVIDRPEWRLRARLPAYRRLVNRARGRIDAWLSQCTRPYIALSGGKDSIVCLNLIQSATNRFVQPVYFDDEWELPETTAYLSVVPSLIRLAHPSYHAPGFTAWNYPEPPEHLRPGTIWTGKTSRPVWLAQQGYDGAAIGLRSDENMRRKIHIRSRGRLFERADNGVWQCYPVADWSIADIWTYIAETGATYNAAYDVMESAGIDLDRQRVGPIWTDQAYCGAEITRQLWPELWRRFVEKFPAASQVG